MHTDHTDFNNINNILTLLLNDIINDETYFPVFHNSPSQTILQNSLYDRNPIRHVVTNEVKETLTPIKFKDAIDRENNLKCSILCDVFQDEDDVIQLPCNHCFFVEPIMKWLTEESCECPVCRYKFESIEKNTREQFSEVNNNYSNYDDIEDDNGGIIEDDIGGIIEGGIDDSENYTTVDQINFNIFNFINNSNFNFHHPNYYSYHYNCDYNCDYNNIEDTSYNEVD